MIAFARNHHENFTRVKIPAQADLRVARLLDTIGRLRDVQVEAVLPRQKREAEYLERQAWRQIGVLL